MKKDNQIKQEIEKRSLYNDTDSGKMFIYALLAPIVLSLLISIIVSSISSGLEIKTEVITNHFGYDIVTSTLMFALFLLIVFFYNKYNNIGFKAINLKFKMKWQTYLILIAVAVVSLFGLQYFINAFDDFLRVIHFPISDDLGGLTPTNGWMYILSIIFLAVTPAISEELLFRGVILNGLRSRFGDYISITLSALMFALMHSSLQQLVYPFLLGLVLGWVVLRTGSLVSSILVHFINNFLVVTFSFINNMTGFSFNLPHEWWFYLLAIGLVAVSFAIYYVIDRFYFKHKSAEEREKSSLKTSKYLYISFGVSALLYVVATIITVVA